MIKLRGSEEFVLTVALQNVIPRLDDYVNRDLEEFVLTVSLQKFILAPRLDSHIAAHLGEFVSIVAFRSVFGLYDYRVK